MESLHKRLAFANTETSDLDRMEVTIEETTARAMRLISFLHDEKILEHDEVSAARSRS